MNAKILLVDDERNVLTAYERVLRSKFEIETALGGEAALAKFSSGGVYAVVVADRQMPGIDGIQLLAKIKGISPDTVRMMLTGNADMEDVIQLVNESNIYRFLAKPCSPAVLQKALEDAQRIYQLAVAERELLNRTLDGSIKLLTDILSMVESPAFGASQAVREAITAAAGRLGLDNAWELQLAAMLAPIGDVTVPPETLVRSRSGQPLSAAEGLILAQRPETASRLLANIPRLEGVAKIVRYQNKGFDGSGFPSDTVAGDKIPIGSRLLRITHDYMDLQRGGADHEKASEAMCARNGHYDPALLAVLLPALEGKAGGPARPARVSLSVKVSELAKGMVLRCDVLTKDGTLLLRAGHHINEMTLEKIRNFETVSGIQEPIMVEGVDVPA